jgi:DNA-directed RNA polymerase specialized sigma24 family protein
VLETIIPALLGGLAAATGKVASKAVEDGYTGLKSLIVSKLGAESEAVEAVKKLEAQPDRDDRKATVAAELKQANVENDPELVEAARRLQEALKELPPEAQSYVQHAVGSYIAQASGGSTATVSVSAPSKQ